MNLLKNLNLPILSQIVPKVISNNQNSESEDENNEHDTTRAAGELVESISAAKSDNSFDLNTFLLKYKEIKKITQFTGIQPKSFFYIFIGIFILIVINFFSKLFTLFVGIVYPLQCSIAALKSNKKREIRKWLEYWIVFFMFLNIETIFGKFLNTIPMYLFYKVVFLFICFLPWYEGAHYFYTSFIKEWFLLHEKKVYKFSKRISQRIEKKIYMEE